jgi:hypothetical protein
MKVSYKLSQLCPFLSANDSSGNIWAATQNEGHLQISQLRPFLSANGSAEHIWAATQNKVQLQFLVESLSEHIRLDRHQPIYALLS